MAVASQFARRTLLALFLTCLCMTGCNQDAKLTKANFDKIQKDMTLKQVEDILGDGTPVGGGGANVAAQFGVDAGVTSTPSSVDYTWGGDKKSITITFKKGKVATKKSSGL